MKRLRKLIREEIYNFLNEIGQGDSYSFVQKRVRKKVVPGNTNLSYKPDEDTYKGMEAEYKFETNEGTEYRVNFESLGSRREDLHDVLKVDFKSMDHSRYHHQPEPLTGEGDAVKIINTVIDCAKDLYKEYFDYIKGFAFSGGLKDKDKQDLESQRAQIYKKVLKRRFSGVKISTIETKWSGDEYFYVEMDR